MDIIRLFEDYGIAYASEEERHYRPGWVNVPCPFCTGNPGYHLGYDTSTDHFYCWRCGHKHNDTALSKILGVSMREAKGIIRQYGGLTTTIEKVSKVKVRLKSHKLPTGCTELQSNHRKYLEKRGFDCNHLIKTWGLLGTGPLSKLDNIDFKHRIIIPIYWEGKQVSFQSRDITDKHRLRYITCPKERELIHHKHILYGKQEVWGDTGICVEGITDVWRFGVNAFATFGIEYTTRQIRVIANTFKRVFVVFDDDPQAVVQADKLVQELLFRNVQAERITITGDPGGMKQDEANYLVKTLLKS